MSGMGRNLREKAEAERRRQNGDGDGVWAGCAKPLEERQTQFPTASARWKESVRIGTAQLSKLARQSWSRLQCAAASTLRSG